MGTLAGGIAHDFNILTIWPTARDATATPTGGHRIVAATRRASGLTRQLCCSAAARHRARDLDLGRGRQRPRYCAGWSANVTLTACAAAATGDRADAGMLEQVGEQLMRATRCPGAASPITAAPTPTTAAAARQRAPG
jgi:hypothetical protein